MANVPTGFAEFVDARGPALIRTASLLELDDAVAQDAVVAALGKVARQWRALSRDGSAEAEARHHVHQTLVDRWRRHDAGNAVPTETALGDDVSAARQALATLTNRQRALVVLSGFDGLTSAEVAGLLRTSAGDVQQDIDEAAARFRGAAGVAADAPLLALLNAAASRDVPADLADRAIEASRSGSRYVLAGAAIGMVALVALTAVVVAVLPEGGDASSDPATANVERWGIPDEARTARGLPSLAEQPIETASMAYITQGVPVVTDATTGEARTVLAGRPTPEWYDGNVNGVITGLLRRGPPWTQAVLSPDGEWLLLIQAPALVGRTDSRILQGSRAETTPFGEPLAPTGDLYLVRIDTGEVTPVPEARPVSDAQGVASVANTNLAWAPGGGAFACVCRNRLAVYDLEPTAPRVVLVSAEPITVTDVGWGAEGLIARRTDGGWFSRSDGGSLVGRMGTAEAAAPSIVSSPVYLSVDVTSVFALGADTDPDGGRCVLWDADFTRPVEVTPVPERDGDLCTPVALQPGRSGVLLVLRPDRPRPQPLPLDVVVVSSSGTSTVIATLPPGTSFASFAAALVG